MTPKQKEQVEAALVDFIVRTAKGETTSQAAIAALPEVVSALNILSRD